MHTYRPVGSFLSGMFPASTIHFHVHIVDDVEKILHNGDPFVRLFLKLPCDTTSLETRKEKVYVTVMLVASKLNVYFTLFQQYEKSEMKEIGIQT